MAQFLHQESVFAHGINPHARQHHAARMEAMEALRFAKQANASGINRSIVQKQLPSADRMNLVDTRAKTKTVRAIKADPEMQYNKEYIRQIRQRVDIMSKNNPRIEQKYQLITNEKPGQDRLVEEHKRKYAKDALDKEQISRYNNVDKVLNSERAMNAYKTSMERTENKLDRMQSGVKINVNPENVYMEPTDTTFRVSDPQKKDTNEFQTELKLIHDKLIDNIKNISRNGYKLNKDYKDIISSELNAMKEIIETDKLSLDKKRIVIGKLSQRLYSRVMANVKADGENLIFAINAVKLFNQINSNKEPISFSSIFDQLDPAVKLMAIGALSASKSSSKELDTNLFEKNFIAVKNLTNYALGVSYNTKKLKEMKQFIMDEALPFNTVAFVISNLEKQLALKNQRGDILPKSEDILAQKVLSAIAAHYKKETSAQHVQNPTPKMEEGYSREILQQPQRIFNKNEPVLRDKKLMRENINSMLDKELSLQEAKKPKHGIRGIKSGYSIF